MATHKPNAKMPASIQKKGVVTVFMPAADHPVVDEKGNKLAPETALEVQRGQMKAAEESLSGKKVVKDKEEEVALEEDSKAAPEKASAPKTKK